MQTLAYDFEIPVYNQGATAPSVIAENPSDVCAVCGERLFLHEALDTSWRSWSAFWKISGTSNVELMCGACGEYLQEIFDI